MRALQFVKTTIVGGLVFLLPFAFVFFVISYVIGYLLPLFHRIAARLDMPLLRGVTLVVVLLTAFLIAICFLAGLVAQSALGGRLRQWIETNLLGRVPVYRLVQSVGDELGGHSATMQVALVWTDGWQLAFIMERHPDGYATVVVPDAPHAMGGTVLYLPEDRVHPVNAKVADVLAIQRRMGLGSAQLLTGKVPPPPAGA